MINAEEAFKLSTVEEDKYLECIQDYSRVVIEVTAFIMRRANEYINYDSKMGEFATHLPMDYTEYKYSGLKSTRKELKVLLKWLKGFEKRNPSNQKWRLNKEIRKRYTIAVLDQLHELGYNVSDTMVGDMMNDSIRISWEKDA